MTYKGLENIKVQPGDAFQRNTQVKSEETFQKNTLGRL